VITRREPAEEVKTRTGLMFVGIEGWRSDSKGKVGGSAGEIKGFTPI